jgi:hypothetical protein
MESIVRVTTGRGAAILAGAVAALWLAEAGAGEVRLISDTLEKVCRVEVASGADAPNTAVETYVDVQKGWSITKPDKLCYRRASTPDNCDSGMTQWNTRWTCAEKTGAGVEEISLK